MDLSKIIGSVAADVAAAGGLVAQIEALTGIKEKLATEFGISPALLDEFTTEAHVLLADGKISPDEVGAEIAKLAAAKGIPPQAVEMAQKMLGGLQAPKA